MPNRWQDDWGEIQQKQRQGLNMHCFHTNLVVALLGLTLLLARPPGTTACCSENAGTSARRAASRQTARSKAARTEPDVEAVNRSLRELEQELWWKGVRSHTRSHSKLDFAARFTDETGTDLYVFVFREICYASTGNGPSHTVIIADRDFHPVKWKTFGESGGHYVASAQAPDDGDVLTITCRHFAGIEVSYRYAIGRGGIKQINKKEIAATVRAAFFDEVSRPPAKRTREEVLQFLREFEEQLKREEQARLKRVAAAVRLIRAARRR